MPLLPTPIARRALATAIRAPLRTPLAARPLSTSQSLRAASSHEDHYDPPGGWLWGQDPSKQHAKEEWEGMWTYGFFGAMAFLVVGYCYKPDTSIQTWALEEARRRLEAEGILPDPEK
ncbi:ESSS subunit of NADH:ubiquinone oxidoreductase [Elsinoe ampelina]|uniref:NADH dehydrogenase [ubiquinone] 1 beta subcomplex subunit 11, mitochondrial n=1 Tax=Elsinoe ampelina TaxID=302913 RepID=A0A6A6G6D0_9PEZI|nr:ESSS subunit of NADH:ubiquinone oxidoreductase [Elsinoe ampelina]